MPKPSARTITELILLFFLSYIGWGMSSIRRFWWQDIDLEDCVDLLFSYVMAVSGYYLFKWLAEYLLRRCEKRSVWVWIQTFGIAGLAVVVWEILINLPYTHFYYRQPLMETSFPEVDLPLTVLVIMALSVFFWQKDQVHALKQAQKTAPPVRPKYQRHFVLAKGKHKVTIREEEIAGFAIKEKLLWLHHMDGQRFLAPFTLKEVEETLDPTRFFRINRQVILSRVAIQQYEPLSNQKLSVSVLPILDMGEGLVVSKYSAAAFKKWLAHSG